MLNLLKQIEKNAFDDINSATTEEIIERARILYLGRNGRLAEVLSRLKDLTNEERKKVGKAANELKEKLNKMINDKKIEVLEKINKEIIDKQWLDVSAPSKRIKAGHLHPLTLLSNKVEKIFQLLGFEIVEGPEVESDYYNFDALNVPKNHPARDLWDTFWIKEDLKLPDAVSARKDKLLLRTHTSPVQVRYMETHNPPFRILAPGRVFRHEATDASHNIQFYQVEGLMVGKDISLANFKSIIEDFFKHLFSDNVKIRLRPSYFPFVEPGVEVDISCISCAGTGNNAGKICSVCRGSGWLEIMGAGMVHPSVLRAAKINPEEWQGFAFGLGLDRIAMMKYKISDVRLFYSGDLKFINQF